MCELYASIVLAHHFCTVKVMGANQGVIHGHVHHLSNCMFAKIIYM